MQNLQKELIEVLKDEDLFIVEDKLNKNKIIESCLRLDPLLITLLINNETFKKYFFVEIENTHVFDKIKFQRFVNNKSFLPDSYTSFKKKIGLIINNENNDEFISTNEDTVLAWPHKDCLLEGGQTKEDLSKRNEIFWNETLSPDSIDRLLDTKALTNFQKYNHEGDKEVDSISLNDNLILKGNNLITISSLKSIYSGKIKLIYIDPPYNTRSDANTFTYNNTFNHSSWLTFMKNRLKISQTLLKKDGVICIAIDDEEYAHLKVLCDEIFGRDNYMGTTIIQSNPRGRTTNTFFATTHDYCLYYAKNIEHAKIYNQPLTDVQKEDFDQEDDQGKYRWLPFRRSGGTSTPHERENSEFTLYYSKKEKNIIAIGGNRKNDIDFLYEPNEILQLDQNNKLEIVDSLRFLNDNKDDIYEIFPIDTKGKRRVWRWSDREKILKAAKSKDFKVSQANGVFTVYLKDRIKGGRKPKTIWSDPKYDASSHGTILLKEIFDGEKVFSYPKSIFTVRDTIDIITRHDKNDIVLDFFGGSGTTAHAVLELNKNDRGNRKFIICEQMDYIETVTRERIKKIIDFNKEGSFIYAELMKFNQIYLDKIFNSSSKENLISIWKEMRNKAFLSYQFDKKTFEDRLEAFKTTSLENMQNYLKEILDKNQLYVNYSEIMDKDHNVNDQEIKLNHLFYKRN